MHVRLLDVFVVVLLLGFSGAAFSQEMPPAQVEVVTLKKVSLAPTMQLKADVVALQNAVLSSEVEGRLQSILYVGNKVSESQSIAKIDPQKLNWQVQREEAKLAGLRADLKFREGEVERFQVLARQDNASKTQLQRELASKQVIEQQILSAKADLAEAQRDLANTDIFAPFNGILVERFAQQGEFIRIGDPLVRLVNENHKDISVRAPIRYRHLFKPKMQVTVESQDSSQSFAIRQVVPVGDPNSRMIEIRLDASGSDLIVGDAVTVYLPKATANVEVPVPRDALVIRGSQRFVYVVDAQNNAKQVQVAIKYAQGNNLVVESGVHEGDKVIIRGAERLQPDSKVSIIND